MPEPAAASPSTLNCPDCGGAVQRARRRPEDRGPDRVRGQRRYRCAAAGCGWQGLLMRPVRRRRVAPVRVPAPVGPTPAGRAFGALGGLPARVAPPLRRAALALGVAAAVAMPLVVVALVGLGVLAGPRAAVAVPVGDSHDGLPVQRASAPAPSAAVTADAAAADDGPLALRQGCTWGQPGRNPYRGSTEQALAAAGLPPEVVREVAALRRDGRKTDRLEIHTGAIRALADGRQFDPRSVALTFGRTLCLNTRVNFAPGHVERADLYEVRDARGRRHAVMVPDVCGNVSVLGARGERGLLGGLADALARRSVDLSGMAAALAAPDATGPVGDGTGSTAEGADGEGPGEHQSAPRGATALAGRSDESSGAAGVEGVVEGGAGLRRPGGLPGPAIGGLAAAGGGGGAVQPAAPAVTVTAAAGNPGASEVTPASRVVASATGQADKSLPRRAAVKALNALSDQLARRSTTVSGLADVLSTPTGGGAGGGAGAAASEVPEPGTLACVLLALGALLAVRARRQPGR